MSKTEEKKIPKTKKKKAKKKISKRYINSVVEASSPSEQRIKFKEYSNNDLIKACANCSMCRDECPTYVSREAESFYAGGRMRILRTIVERNLPITDDFVEAMFLCTTCKQCEDICPIGVKYVDLIEELRAELVQEGIGPYGNLIGFSKSICLNNNPYGEPPSKRADWVEEGINVIEKGPYAYFVGCTSSYRTQSAAVSTGKILTKILGGIVLLGPEEVCCGSPIIRTGQIDFQLEIEEGKFVPFTVEDYITRNIENIIKKEVEEVIFSCSGCYKTSTDDWPKYFSKDIPFKRTHISQFLARLVEQNKIQFKPFNKKVTYHDPCHLGRHRKVYDDPRTVLQAIPELEFIEMRKNRNRSRCCGAGGGVKAGFAADALSIATVRVQEAIDAGADILATSCVFCKYNFLDAKKEMGADIEILNIEDIVVDLL